MKTTIISIASCLLLISCDSQIQNSSIPDSVPDSDIAASTEGLQRIAKDTTAVDDSLITREFLLGKFDYRSHPLFTQVPPQLSNKDIYIQNEVLRAFQSMSEEAMKDKITLRIVSGTRSFQEQKRIWENKWQRESPNCKSPKETAMKILEFSSMPSTSRHHWGTDIDINSVESSYFKNGQGAAEYAWLQKNGARFGFFQTYTSKENGRTGYSMEEWHWSYMPLARKYLSLYNKLITNKDITGFNGCETASEIDIIKNFVNGIEGQ